MQTRGLPGFRDFYPDDTALRNHIFGVWRDIAARYGFVEYDGPPLEPLELYTQKSGDEIVDQLYAFVDKGGRHVALRPEMTPTLARMVGAKAGSLRKPIRWFSLPQLFRYERQQRGRLREHFQLNMDLIGEPGPLADAEIVAAAVDVLRAFGFGAADVRVRISDRRAVAALLRAEGVPADELPVAYAAIDKLERAPRDKLLDRLGAAWREVGDAELPARALAVGEVRGVEQLCRRMADAGAEAGAAEGLVDCVQALDAMGLGEFIDVDLSVVRGLAYYTGIVFELFDAARSLRAICGGGRYDGLLGALGGADLPAVGFGMGDVVLAELLRARGAAPASVDTVDVFLVAVTAADGPEVQRLAHALRDRGLRVEFALRSLAIGKQLGLAAARGARRAVVIGPDERVAGAAVVRDLRTSAEERVGFDALLDDYAWR